MIDIDSSEAEPQLVDVVVRREMGSRAAEAAVVYDVTPKEGPDGELVLEDLATGVEVYHGDDGAPEEPSEAV
jgi:hypothetical protein